MGQQKIKKQKEEEILAEITKSASADFDDGVSQPQGLHPRGSTPGVGKKKTRSAKYKKALIKVDRRKFYSFEDALKLTKETSYAKFDASIEAHLCSAALKSKEKKTNKPAKTTLELEKNKIKYHRDSQGNIHLILGKVSEPDKKLAESWQAITTILQKEKIQSATLSATMGPGIKVRI